MLGKKDPRQETSRVARFFSHALPFVAFTFGTWLSLRGTHTREIIRPESHPNIVDLTNPASPDLGESLEQTSVPWPRLNPTARIDRAWLLADGPERRDGAPGVVTLTFDDGPFPETTPYVLKSLKKYDMHATFFLIGKYLAGSDDRCVKSRETARQILAEGHLIGNHSYDHARLGGLEEADALDEIDRSARAITKTLGSAPRLFRPPYGSLTPSLEEALAARNQELVLWNIEVGDMTRDDPDRMFEELRAQIIYNKGGIVLLHDIRWSSVLAFKKLAEWLDSHRFDRDHPERGGYDVVDLGEYLRRTAMDPPKASGRAELERARAEAFKANDEKKRHRAAEVVLPLVPQDDSVASPASEGASLFGHEVGHVVGHEG